MRNRLGAYAMFHFVQHDDMITDFLFDTPSKYIKPFVDDIQPEFTLNCGSFSHTCVLFSSILLHGLGTELVRRRYGVNPEPLLRLAISLYDTFLAGSYGDVIIFMMYKL